MRALAIAHTDSRGLITRSRQLCHDVHALVAHSAALIARAAELCTVFRRISGSSDLDSPLIVEFIAASSACLACVATKTGVPIARAKETVERVRAFMAVIVETGRCEACLKVTTVYRLGDRAAPGPAAPLAPKTSPPAMTHNEAIWRFLESRRGEMFCTQCITNALLASKRIDRAILGAEGRGAKRQHGRCASCGKERLLCGLVG